MKINLAIFTNLTDSIKSSIRTIFAFIILIVLFYSYIKTNKNNFYIKNIKSLMNKSNITNKSFYIGILLILFLVSISISMQIPTNLINCIGYTLIIGILIFGSLNLLLLALFKLPYISVIYGTLVSVCILLITSISTYFISNEMIMY